MKKITPTTQFKKDYKKLGQQLKPILEDVLNHLRAEIELPLRYKDHKLIGQYNGHRECHLKPDKLLIYQPTETEIILVRLGSHSELFR